MMTLTSFRADFPEFGNTVTYPDAVVTVWMTLAITLVANADRWGATLSLAQELVTAHYLTLQARDLAAAASTNGTPGAAQGLLTSQAVGPISESYDFNLIADKADGQWNMTSYGQRYARLVRVFGSGGLQLGTFPRYPIC